MSTVTGPILEGSALVQETLQTAYVDLGLDQTLSGGVQNGRPSRDLQTRNSLERRAGGAR